ncbi:transcriptional regulator family: Fungal Specific TF [Penicillium roqueforti]|uniref:Zn(2)-C6 fungal-type DNA-binding domain n=1 Tax=Penicillium roqueforti (strain FM164) TaxID=1365484 RepID=W6PR14_PENRF|nr:transcriptional regulator family: Fungal Specific TF [Penicillium roqueforti]CDM26300.1 Zn(2)-C6 fungal-type DNA-binding domain [Penicillium roqueforti FM164]KAF9242465.1 transcriptional regulator family: Fungal Specific TF [Penicillium roqueforti]KAI1834664.1 transcriptional regulator family: Fungal Specific TF [Penicillium roqueforti]KAI2676508.1 transcriptional regulator family: Fungal Specific TF [Penicillium roqueforti]KAI2681263.1 transcriptional regulator family: Fungal Specific TF [
MIGGTQQSVPDSRVRKAPNRQSRSCKVCRLRKVKCDRVKPCHACCAHGYPSKCVYEHVPDEEAGPISQAEEIRNLRAEIRELRGRIDDKHNGSGVQDLQRLDQLENLFESIRSAPSPLVDNLIRDVRNAHVGLKKGLVPVGPWEGREAYESYDYPSRHSSLSVRNRGLLNSPVEDFNNLRSEEDDDSDFERMSQSSGSDSSGTISVMSMQRPAVDVFVERFVDAFSPEVDMKSGRAGALRAAAGIRMFSPLMTDAFEAVSVAFFGRSVQNKQIEASGFRLYPRVLRALQDALVDPEKCKAESTLVTVTLLLAFESVERTTQSGVLAHVRGAVRLFEHRGPENHMYGVEHLLFTELRPYWIGGALAARQPSFLAREEWKTIPWSAGTSQKDILHHLLDLATEVPGLLAVSDAFKEAQITSVMGAQEMAIKQSTLWNGIRELTARFYQWHQEWVVAYPDGPPQEAEQKGDQGFPIFQRRDLRTGATFIPTKFTYPNLLLAQTMCMYYAVRLILSSIDTRPEDRVSPMEQYDLGCGICRSLEFYILTAPGNMINRLAFPTRVAWEAFPDGGPERHFMIEVLQLVEKRHALGLWGSSMPELSTKEASSLNRVVSRVDANTPHRRDFP